MGNRGRAGGERGPHPASSSDHHALRGTSTFALASTTYGMRPPLQRSEKHRGRRVLEQVVFSMVLCCGLLAFGAGMMGSRYVDVESLERSTKVERLLAQTLDCLSAYSFDAVSAMDGRSVLEKPAGEHSDYRVDLAVTPASDGLLQIRAILLDNRTSRELMRVVTWRGKG